MKKPTYLRWLLSLSLIAFIWVGGFAQPQKKAELNTMPEEVSVQNPFYMAPGQKGVLLYQSFDVWPPVGWVIQQQTASTNGWTSSTTAYAGGRAAYHSFYSGDHESWLISPQITVPAAGVIELSFYERNVYVPADYDYSGVLVSNGSGAAGSADFVQVYESNLAKASYVKTSIDLSAYAGDQIYIAFVYEGDFAHSWYVDEVVVDAITCPQPTDLVVTNITANSADVSWTAGGTETSWNLIWGDFGFNPMTDGTMVAGLGVTTHSLTGLGDGASYQVYVQAACGAGDESEWTGPISFATVIGTFPWNETFEANSPSLGGWTQQYVLGTADWTLGAGAGGGAITAAQEGTQNYRFVSSSGSGTPVTRLISPILDLSSASGAVTLNFWYAQQFWSPTVNELRVYYRESETDIWTQLLHLDYDIPTWTNFSMELPNPSNTYQIAFEGINNYGRRNVLDNVTISMAPPGLSFVNANLNMGHRPIGAWMEPARFEVVNNPGAGDLSIIAADIDNNYGGFVDVVNPALPYTLASGETTTEFGLTANVEAIAAEGAFNGQYALIYSEARALATATYEGIAYEPELADVVETAYDIGEFGPAPVEPFTITQPVSRELNGQYKNYILPNDVGYGPLENDFVYKMTFLTDKLFSITGAQSPNYVVYAEDFGGEPGPMAHNAVYQHIGDFADVPLFAGTYYLVVSDIMDWETFTPDIVNMPAPDAVTYLTPLDGALNITNGTLLSWTFGNNTSEYELVLGTTYPPTTVVVPYTTNLATSYTLTGLQPNMQYFWRVNVKNTNGTTAGPVWGFTTTIDVPTAFTVTLVDPVPTDATVSANLNWTGPSDRAFVGYNVYRDGVRLNTAPVTVSQYTDLGLARNTTYAYTVSNVFDEGESAQTAPVSVTTQGVGIFNGYVYDFLTNDPIAGATVRIIGPAGDYTLTTAANGSYSTQAYAGTYNITASADDYTSQTIGNQVLAHAGTVSNTFYLNEVPYPVADVVAFELDANKVQVSWSGSAPPPPPPLIAEWLGYDENGVPTQNWYAGVGAPFSWAINFEPADLADLVGTSLTKLAIYNFGTPDVNTLNVYSGNLADGTATLIHTQALTGITLNAWNEIDLTLPVPIDVTKQLWVSVHSPAPTGGVAPSTPILNLKGDWVNFTGVWQHMSSGLGYNVTWSLRAFATNASNRAVTELVHHDFKARYNTNVANTALVSTPITGAESFRPVNYDRGIVDYSVWREKVYQPGSLEQIGTVIGQGDFVDFDWGNMDWGVYRWAVTVNYDAGQSSAPTFSNTLDKDMNTVVNVSVVLSSGDSPAGTEVTFTNTSEPDLELVYEGSLGGSGQLTWDIFRKGVYDIEVFKAGYSSVSLTDITIFDETSFEWLLEEILAPPTGLYVTPTGYATWEGGTSAPFTPFMEDFNGGSVPTGWTVVAGAEAEPGGGMWHVVNPTSGRPFTNSPYMIVDADQAGYYYTHSILTSPVIDAAGAGTLFLEFDQYFNQIYSDDVCKADVFDGTAWVNVLDQTADIGSWTVPNHQVIDVSAYANPNFQVRFEYFGDWAWYWAIDNVALNEVATRGGDRAFETYKVFHDGVFVADVQERMYQYGTNGEALVDGETYLAEVATVYSTGQSTRASYTWTYIACDNYASPANFAAAQVEGALDVNLTWTIPAIPVGEDQIVVTRIYRDGLAIAETDAAMYLDEDLDIGPYEYCVTFVYETGAESCPGTICKTVVVTGGGFVSGNVKQAAYLGGANLQGAVVTLTSGSNTFTFTTNASGNYSGEVLGNRIYNYTVEAIGYVTQTLTGIEILMTETEVRNFLMLEFPAPVELVYAEELNDNQVKVSWRSPGTLLFEPFMEDFSNGLSEWTSSASNWGISQSSSAGGTAPELRFNWSPSGTGDYSIISPVLPYANGNNALYLSFKHMVNDFSGGYTIKVITVADGVTHVVQEWTPTGSIGANTVNAVITDAHGLNAAEFQIGFMFSGVTFDINYWYIDDVMVSNTRARNNERDLPESTLAGYNVYRTSCVDGGNLQFLGYTLDSIFNDNTWGTAESGTYKWAVEAVYAENESEIRFSNCLDKDMNTAVSVQVATNSGDSPEGTAVMFTNTSEPELELVYNVTLDETGYYAWEEFRKGTYDIHVEKLGFAAIDITDEIIDGPKNYVWLLEELLLPVSDLHVSPTGYATWREGGMIPFEPFIEDFSGGIDNWTRTPATANWQLSQTGLAGGAAPEVRFYWSPNSTNRFYFISPMMSTLTQTELEMSFNHYISDYSGTYDIQLVTIANGVEHLVMDFPAASIPATNVVTALTAAHGVGAEEFQIAFVFDGIAFDINNWNIDNIMLYTPGSRELEYYKVWLDGIFIADTPNPFYQYNPDILIPGQEYFSEVAAIYSNGMSPKMGYTWIYYPCDSFPGPADLTYEVVNINNVVLNWSGNTPPPPPGGDFFEGFEDGNLPTGWKIYDVDGDGYNWENTAVNYDVFEAHTGDYCMTSASYINNVGALNPNNWLVTPAIAATATSELKFWVAGQDPAWASEKYNVKVSTTGNAVADFTTTLLTSVSTGTWQEKVANLATYAGQTIYIAFQHTEVSDMYFIKLDDVTVTNTATRAAHTSPLAAGVSNAIPFKTQGMSQSEIDARLNHTGDYASKCVAEKATPNANAKAITGIGKSLAENRAVLFNNGPMVNSAGTGAGGADESILDASLGHTTYGFNVSQSLGYHMADDFVVDATWTVESLEFFGYQTGSSTTSSFTGLYFQIYNGAPNAGGTVIFGDMTTNRMSSTSWTNIYRNDDGPGGSTNRPIMKVVANVTGLTLQPGTYWVEYTLAGSLASGPWSSAITINGQAVTGNALQWTGSAWQALVDGVHPQGIPFLINGTSGGGGGGGSTTFDPGEFLGANVYRNGELIAEMVQGETYTDMEVEPGYYDYCVTFVYENNAMSCMTTCVTDVLVTEDCKVPQNLTATEGDANEVTLAWNQQVQEEFRYDDGTSTGQLGFSGGTTNGVLGAKHNATAEITELSWFTTAEGGPHTSVKIYVMGLSSSGMPNGANVLYSATVSNTDNTWNTHTLPTPVTANGGFYIALGYNGFAGLGTDDGVGAPYVFPNNTHYYSSDYTGNSWTTFESSGFPVNAMIRAIGMAGAKASYAVTAEMAAEFDKAGNPVIYTIHDPVATGAPEYSVQTREMNREFMGYNIYKNGSLFVPLWPETTYVYQEGMGGQTCYTVTAEYEFCGETDPSNEVCVTLIDVKPNDLSKIKVYPNPSNNTVNIDLTPNISQVVIYNYLGQVVYENNITDEVTLHIDVLNYEAGAYLVKFVTDQGRSLTKKVVVTK